VPDFVLGHTQDWLDRFSAEGYRPRPLAAGVEGAIYDLGDDLIAKVWRARRMAELESMQRFYADVAAVGLPFQTPQIQRMDHVGGNAVTYERKLPGVPLQNQLRDTDQHIGPAATECVVSVLQALATVRATDSMRQLTVLDEDQPLWAGADSYEAALLGLLARRVARFGDVIRGHLPDFDARYAALTAQIRGLRHRPDTVIHGDLFGGNILVDTSTRPVAVLDFGFLTSVGDPAMDAAIAAAVINMYGPHAARITEELTGRIARDLDYDPETLRIYQAAYAVATSNAFTADGTDGHFAWCIDQLRRQDITRIPSR
jgi:aminoglycoside phosphotransferase (APT) family kinase protein